VRENLVMAARPGATAATTGPSSACWRPSRAWPSAWATWAPAVGRRAADAVDRPRADDPPELIILDEATEGLAPLIVAEIWRVIGDIRASGIATLIVDRDYARCWPTATAPWCCRRARHHSGPDVIARVAQALRDCEANASQLASLKQAVDDYADFQWSHMRKEEQEILPAAERALLPADWELIDAAFKSNNDPLVGVERQQEFRELFRRVVNLMPAPMGLGPAQG
jgi:hypothetical protein